MRRVRGKIIAVCTVVAVILAAKAALTAEIPVVYAEDGSDIDKTAVLEADGEDKQDTELPAFGDGEDEDGDEKDGDADKAGGGVNSGTDSADGSQKDGDTDKAGGDVNSGTDSAADSQTDGGNKTDSMTDADTADTKADSDADVKTEDDTLADTEEETEETLPPAEIRSVFSLRSSRSTGTDIGSFDTIDDLNNTLKNWANKGAVEATLSEKINLTEGYGAISVPAGVDLTLNMNNCSLSGFSNNGINVTGGTLTLTGTGSIECNNGYGIYINGGNVTLEGSQTITAQTEAAIHVSGSGTLNISGGGSVTGGAYGIYSNESNVNINSSSVTVTATAGDAWCVAGYDTGKTLTIKGGTFKAQNGKSLRINVPDDKVTITGGSFPNGISIKSSEGSGVNDLPIGNWASGFYGSITGGVLSDNTFSAGQDGSNYYVHSPSGVTVSSGSWNGKYKEYRLLDPGKKYSFKDAGCKVSGDDTVYKACDFYVSEEEYYTFTKE